MALLPATGLVASMGALAPPVEAQGAPHHEQVVRVANEEWERWNRGALRECTNPGPSLIAKYGTATGGMTCSNLWSAAFISWTVREAGAGSRFGYSNSHSTYIVRAVQDKKSGNTGALYLGERHTAYAPQTGDLVCAARDNSGATYDTTGNYKAHCDVVVATRAGAVEVIGGNVSDSVKRETKRTDGSGKLTGNYIAVLRNTSRVAAPPLNTAVWAVNSCGSLITKPSFWGQWSKNMDCNQATDVSVSPDGGFIYVITPDKRLIGKWGMWGQWETLLGNAKSVSATANGWIWAVDECGAVKTKSSFFAAWTPNTDCNFAKSVSVSPDGAIIMVVTPDGKLMGKYGQWGQWAEHLGAGDTKAVAASANGWIWAVTSCGSLISKPAFWGTWSTNMPCDQATSVAVSPDGGFIFVITPDKRLIGKWGQWGQWSDHLGVGDTKAVDI